MIMGNLTNQTLQLVSFVFQVSGNKFIHTHNPYFKDGFTLLDASTVKVLYQVHIDHLLHVLLSWRLNSLFYVTRANCHIFSLRVIGETGLLGP